MNAPHPGGPAPAASAGTDGRKRKPRVGLATTAVFAVLLIGLPLLVLLGSSLAALRQAAYAAGAERALGIARLQARFYEHTLAEWSTLLTAMAALPQLRPGAGADACNALLGDLLETGAGLSNLGVVDTDGTLRCSALPFPPGVDLSHRDWFRAALANSGFVAGDYQVGTVTGVASTNLAYAVTGSDGSPSGVVFAAVSVGWLTQRVRSAAHPPGATLDLLDRGLRVMASHPALPGPARYGERPAWDPAFIEALGSGSTSEGTFEARGLDGARRVYAYVAPEAALPLAKPPLVVVGLPLEALKEPYDAIVRRQVGQFAVALGVLLVLAGGISHFDAVRPTRRLALAARRFAAGDASARAGDPGGAREFLELAQGFNAAAERASALLAALRLLSAGNRVLLRGDTEPALLEAMCRVAVEAGGYRSAQVVYRHVDGMQLKALAGDEGTFLRSLETHWQAARAGETPTPGAIFSGCTVVLNDTRTSAVPALNQAAARAGVRAAIGLPLRVEGEVIGAFTIYAAQGGVFGPHEVGILEEMADDLAFGITTARLRERHLEADARLQQLLYHDQVTGLPNGLRFLEEFARGPALAAGPTALLVVHLGNYWDVAAALGPAQGDALLRAVAERLRELRPALLARIAQAEFALVLTDDDATPAEAILARLDQPFPLPQIQVDVEASVGVARAEWPTPAAPDRLLQAARLAAHEARQDPARWRPANRDLEQQWAERLALAGELRAALGGPEFTLHVQPQLDLHSGTICAVEALARWQHPQRGAIPPARFIGIAESTGLIGPLTWQVLELARELGGRYAAAGIDLPIAVNISARNLHDAELVPRLRALQDGWNLPPGRLHLEITETALMADPALSRRVLRALRDLGLPVYLDDFGTGYSSLAYVRELPLDGIKLDRAFIAALDEPFTQRIVSALCDLAPALGLRVIAEGIENADHLTLLKSFGCRAAQGYAIARPMPGEAFIEWLRAFRAPAP